MGSTWRLAWLSAVALGAGASPAWSQDADDDDDVGASAASDDEGDEEDLELEEDEVEEGQPPVTAGGLYSVATYPTRLAQRPLTLSEKMWEFRLGVGTDISASQAFKTWGTGLHVRYGVRDHVEAFGGVATQYSGKQFDLYAGLEGALLYDLLDVRLAFRINRPAVLGADGSYGKGPLEESFDIGFPFRYEFRKEIALVALDTVMNIEFHSRPDLLPSLAFVASPLSAVSAVLRVQAVIVDFNTDVPFTVPASLLIQVSPTARLDLGAEVKFLNFKPEKDSDRKFYDDRFLTLYLSYRM